MGGKAGYKSLLAWQKADELAHSIYEITAVFPKQEIFGITSQIKRAALSVPLNIAEDSGRNGKRELKQFLNIALGSLSETEYLIDFSTNQGI